MKKILFILLILCISAADLRAQYVAHDGNIDSTFGLNGSVICSDTYYPNTYAYGVTALPDGGIVLLTRFVDTAYNRKDGLLKLRKDGTIDSSFGTNGTATFGSSFLTEGFGLNSITHDALGRIITIGTGCDSTVSVLTGFLINRYLPNGLPDNTFNKTGTSIAYFGDSSISSNAFAVQADGKYVVVGQSANGNAAGPTVLMRFNTDGSLDSAFGGSGSGGLKTQDLGEVYFSSFALQPDGKFLIVGEGNFNSLFVRLKTDGKIDSSFGKYGNAASNTKYQFNAVKILPDNKILDGGSIDMGSPYMDFLVGRYNSNGTFDSTFGTNGITHNNISGASDLALQMLIQTDEKIILGGQSFVNSDLQELARYTKDGRIDSTFGINGATIQPTDSTNMLNYNVFYDMDVQPDGDIITAGYIDMGVNQYFASRYIAHPYRTSIQTITKNNSSLYPQPYHWHFRHLCTQYYRQRNHYHHQYAGQNSIQHPAQFHLLINCHC